MAHIEHLIPKIFRWEGGWSDDLADHGGQTNMGITLATWKCCGYDKDHDGDIDSQDLQLITQQDVVNLLRVHYWNRWKADEIHNQSVANLLVDWVWNSGKYGILIPQRILSVKPDGIVGEQTLLAVNSADQSHLFHDLKEARKSFFLDIAKKDPSQKRFLGGWLNRINDFQFSTS